MIDTRMNIVRIDKNEYELENGDIYPHFLDFDENLTKEDFQKILTISKDMILLLIKKIEE